MIYIPWEMKGRLQSFSFSTLNSYPNMINMLLELVKLLSAASQVVRVSVAIHGT